MNKEKIQKLHEKIKPAGDTERECPSSNMNGNDFSFGR